MPGLRDFSDMVGGYWADDNARFEQTQPGVLRRIVRMANPITGVGSAIGSMYEHAGKGDAPGMALDSFNAMPIFGMARLVKAPAAGAAKEVATRVAQGLRGWKQQLATEAAGDMYDQRGSSNAR